MTPLGVDVLDEACGPARTWTRVNIGEAFPGVPTPLTWSWAGPASDELIRRAWVEMGVFPRSLRERPPAADDRFAVILAGRAVLNLDLMRAVGDRLPANSGDKIEASIFGSARDGIANRPTARRYPVIAARLPVALGRARRSLLRLAPDVHRWWEHATRPETLASPEEARRLLVESGRRYVEAGVHQCVGTIAGQGLFDGLAMTCRRAGLAGTEGLLATADATPESLTVADLWSVARGGLTIDEFLHRHGYHAPVQGELSAPSWREDRRPVERLVETFAARRPSDDPQSEQRRRMAERAAAEGRLRAASGPAGGRAVVPLVRLTRRYVPLREVARMLFLHCYDVARAASRRLGVELAERGVIDDPGDVYYLTVEEVLAGTGRLADAVAERRQRRAYYEAHTVPLLFTGPPRLEPVTAPAAVDHLEGLPGSGGVVEGRARVILDPDDPQGLEDGEILVCETTNPSWASFFFVASGVVVDIGGPLSHAAIVAREMGIPCVINTRDARHVIRTGDRIRVDGDRGVVEVLERAVADAGERQ